jgi:hypothetical protein
MDSTTLEQAAQAAYEAHHAEMFDIAWNDMPDWKKERWRWAAKAVLTSIQHPSELLQVMREMTTPVSTSISAE